MLAGAWRRSPDERDVTVVALVVPASSADARRFGNDCTNPWHPSHVGNPWRDPPLRTNVRHRRALIGRDR
jgi:hypothetical protein